VELRGFRPQRAAQRFALLAGGRAWIKLQEQDSVRV
jgi:hypothetical protein